MAITPSRHDTEVVADRRRSGGQVATRRGTNLGRVADFNESVILDAIRTSEAGMSRVELTQLSGLSAQTVSNISRRLLEQGLVTEAGKERSANGKPRTLLKLRADSRYALGIHVDPAMITVVLLDLLGTVVSHRRVTPPETLDPAEVVDMISAEAEAVIVDAGVDRKLVLGLGLAVPGPLDRELGIVLRSPHMPAWRHVNLHDQLEERLHLSVEIDKDVVAAAIGERWAGSTSQSAHFLFFYFGTGIGVGLVSEDRVIRGVSGNAGDIGMMPVAGDPDRVEDGIPETYLHEASLPRTLLQRAQARGVLPPDLRYDHPSELAVAFAALTDAAEGGDAIAAEILDRAAQRIAETCVTLSNLLDVDTVVLGGALWDRVSARFLPLVADTLRSTALTAELHHVDVVTTPLGEDVAAIGAACLVLDRVFAPRASSMSLEA